MLDTFAATRERGLLSSLPLSTARLRMRKFRPTDQEALYALHRDGGVTRFAGGSKNKRESLATLQRIIERVNRTGFGPLAVTRRCDRQQSEALIGWCGVQPLRDSAHYEIIYALAAEFWGYGYATEAAGAIMHIAFSSNDLVNDEIVGLVYPQNLPSIRVLEKLGMMFREYRFDHPNQRYACLYSVGRSKFLCTYAQSFATTEASGNPHQSSWKK